MPALNDYAGEGVLTINSIVMNNPAWAVIGDERGRSGLLQLLFAIRKRGEDREVPGAADIIPYPRRRTKVEVDLRLVVTGDVNSSGVANADSATGLVTNLEAIYDGIIEPSSGVSATAGTVAATFVGLGASVSTNLHVLGWEQDEYHLGRINGVSHQSLWTGLLTVSLPTGRFT